MLAVVWIFCTWFVCAAAGFFPFALFVGVAVFEFGAGPGFWCDSPSDLEELEVVGV